MMRQPKNAIFPFSLGGGSLWRSHSPTGCCQPVSNVGESPHYVADPSSGGFEFSSKSGGCWGVEQAVMFRDIQDRIAECTGRSLILQLVEQNKHLRSTDSYIG